jgi:hypothetical protein
VYGGPATVGEYADAEVLVAGSEPERAVGRIGLGLEAEAAVCTESTWADWRRECWELELEVGGALRSSFRDTETSAYWLMPRLSSRRLQCADSAASSESVGEVGLEGLEVIAVGMVVVRVLAAWDCDCDWECLHAINDERRLAVVEGDSRAGDGLDIAVTSYRGQSECEYGSTEPRCNARKEGKQREGGREDGRARQGGYTGK